MHPRRQRQERVRRAEHGAELTRWALLLLAVLASWELGQLVATYVEFGLFKETYAYGIAPGGGWGQIRPLLVLALRIAISAVVALPLVLLSARVLRPRREPS